MKKVKLSLVLIMCNIFSANMTDAAIGSCKKIINGIKVSDYMDKPENLTESIPTDRVFDLINCVLERDTKWGLVPHGKDADGSALPYAIQTIVGNLNAANILYTLSQLSSKNFLKAKKRSSDNFYKWSDRDISSFNQQVKKVADVLLKSKHILLEDEHVALLCKGLNIIDQYNGVTFKAFWGIKESILNSLNKKIKDDNNQLIESASKKPMLYDLTIEDIFLNDSLVSEAKEAIINHISAKDTFLTNASINSEQREQVTQAIKKQAVQ
jgi:hypothetical protein